MPDETKSELSTELARARSEAAMDRTLMAWVRTALAAIGFGFGLEKTIGFLRASDVGRGADAVHQATHMRLMGAAFIVLGTLSLIVAFVQHMRWRKLIQRKQFVYRAPWPLVEAVALVVGIIGIYALYAVFR